ncbi:transcriptional regulator [Paenibacillus swuensis]|uniref:Transcriptional regulator n=1 Tax=Paenibacillus swuensis TaxID=1178515 RepID=A0A172THK2_9BACL|nr:helix-turn-helix domain-containing protein [Paenibacillus swuensis]ANE46263.1 transcriptional regulator [Paenibacillus swuensis]
MIGQRIKELRKRKGYSISELAELAGISKSYLSYIERELQNNPSLQMLSKIAGPLDTTIEYLLGNTYSSRLEVNGVLDDEWKFLIHKAIDEGMSKKDFRRLKDYLQYLKWNEHKEGSNS